MDGKDVVAMARTGNCFLYYWHNVITLIKTPPSFNTLSPPCYIINTTFFYIRKSFFTSGLNFLRKCIKIRLGLLQFSYGFEDLEVHFLIKSFLSKKS